MAAIDYVNHDPVVHTWSHKMDEADNLNLGNDD